MSQNVVISKRDAALLSLLNLTPATAVQIRKASVTFGDDAFRDERRVRERLQALSDAGLVKSFAAAIAGGGSMHYHRLTTEGYRVAFPNRPELPHRSNFAELSPSRIRHALIAADAIVHTLVACHHSNVRVNASHGDGQLVLQVGEYRQIPDFHFQLAWAGQFFNLLFEIDNATEPLDSQRDTSIRTKILGYEAYQNWVLKRWAENGRQGPRPSFRVAFLTTGSVRANHILWLAGSLAQNRDRRLIYATTQDVYLGAVHAVTEPIFNDHLGGWQSLINHQPTSSVARQPIRLNPPVVESFGL